MEETRRGCVKVFVMRNKRTAGNRETVLLYRFRGTEIGQRLYVAAARMGILCKVIEKEQTDEVLGALLKLPGFSESVDSSAGAAGADLSAGGSSSAGADLSAGAGADLGRAAGDRKEEELPRQAMVMYGFTQKRLDEFLRNTKKAGVPVIPLKAIVTPYNVNWTFRALYEELEREEEVFRKKKEEK